jgi:putative DNA primase/helicase
MKLADLIDLLQDARECGDGYLAKCPAHDDRRASLSVKEDGDKLLLNCHAGCSTPTILKALGLHFSDLYLSAPARRNGHSGGQVIATYDYQAEDGTLLYQVLRKLPKDFVQRKPDGAGGWTWKLGNTRRVLYHLPELLGADPLATVYVAEGEKGVDRLRLEGAIATCSPHGAGKWRPAYAPVLAGRHVVVLPDNDNPGRDHAESVARSLTGVATSVKVLALPGLPAGADAYDWLEAGHTLADLDALAAATPEWIPSATASPLVAERDLAHAEALATLWKDAYRWAPHRGLWYQWTGQVWAPITEEQAATHAADDLRRHYADQIAAARDDDQVRRYTRLAKETCMSARVNGGLYFLKGRDGFHTDAEEWDADPWALNVANGVVDLRTGTLRPHDPQDLLTKLAPVDYDPNAAGPVWDAHLALFLPDADVRRQVQRDLGLALYGGDLEEFFDIWYGTGANGKSTTTKVLKEILGDYAARAAPNLLIQRAHEAHPTEIADLSGRRVVFSVEISARARLDEAKVKDLTGGDRIKARYMRQDFFEFAQTWTIFLLVNHRPIITGTDNGIWRRVRLVPWTVTMPEDHPARQPQDIIVSRLIAEGPAILRWLVEGFLDWQRERRWIADAVRAATDEYRANQDRLAGFLADCCEELPRVSTPVGDLYTAYTDWCEAANEDPLGKNPFSRQMMDRGFSQKKGTKGLRRWLGIRLLSTPKQDELFGDDETRPDTDTISHSPLDENAFPGEQENTSVSGHPDDDGRVAHSGTVSHSPLDENAFPGEQENPPPCATHGEPVEQALMDPPEIGDRVHCLDDSGNITTARPLEIVHLYLDEQTGEQHAVLVDADGGRGMWPLERCAKRDDPRIAGAVWDDAA